MASKHAFTLFELLVAMTLMVVTASCLYSSLYIGFKAKDSAEQALVPLQAAQTAMDMLTQDLRGAVEPNTSLAGAFEGINDRDGSSRDTDHLVFYSSHHTINDTPSRMTCGIGLIELALIPSSDSDAYVLVRLVTDNILSSQTTEPIQEIICRHVHAMNLRYFDGTDWVDVWDSEDHQDILPLAVEITLGIEPISPANKDKVQSLSRYDKAYGYSICTLTQVVTLPRGVSEETLTASETASLTQPAGGRI